MKRLFFYTFSFFLLLWGVSLYALSRDEQIQQIDREIAELQEVKRGYEARAIRQEDLGEYLQFENQAWLETRRHWQLAEENWRQAELVQKKIDLLEERKKKLQQKSSFF